MTDQLRQAQMIRDALKLRPHSHTRPWQEAMDALDSLLVRLKEARDLLLDIEGTIIAYWTDIPEAELERLRQRIREVVDG